ncbi:hypothetical protein F5Y17DRAFT_458043 [Xylariaceae sp. FL0594]|nr:hypothetical protein F5Y17DRAFT_458043 [Xylariaceae sp. FL0594]
MKPTSPLFLFLGFGAYCAAAPMDQQQRRETVSPDPDATFVTTRPRATKTAVPHSPDQYPGGYAIPNPNLHARRPLRQFPRMPHLNVQQRLHSLHRFTSSSSKSKSSGITTPLPYRSHSKPDHKPSNGDGIRCRSPNVHT